MNFDECRLDRYVKKIYGKNIPQSIIEKATRNGDIKINNAKAKSSDRVLPSDNVFVKPSLERIFANIFCSNIDHPRQFSKFSETQAKDFSSMIIFENEDLLVVNKPAGLAAQLGSKTHVAVDVMAKQYFSEARLVHRIDKETSGITILAKNIETARYMLFLFQTKQIKKTYAAITTADIAVSDLDAVVKISKPLIKNKDKVVVDFENGKDAVTEIRFVKRLEKGKVLISACPQTGRTHQIRVHLASIDCPIVGDRKYGGQKAKHLFLHSSEARFLSRQGKKICLKAEFPEYFQL